MEKEKTQDIADQTIKIEKNSVCRRCGRKLKNPESIKLGFGGVCYRKHMNENQFRPLFTNSKKKDVMTYESSEKG